MLRTIWQGKDLQLFWIFIIPLWEDEIGNLVRQLKICCRVVFVFVNPVGISEL